MKKRKQGESEHKKPTVTKTEKASLPAVEGITKNDSNEKLLYACWKGDLKTVINAVQAGANVNAKIDDDDGSGTYFVTPLHRAAESGEFNVAEYLIEQGADVNSTSDMGATPLHYAVVGKSTKVAKLFLENGADIGARDDEGRTPLHWAVWVPDIVDRCNPRMIKFLMENGADLHSENNYGESIVYILRNTDYEFCDDPNYPKTLRYLLETWEDKIDNKTALFFAVIVGDRERVKKHLKEADINSEFEYYKDGRAYEEKMSYTTLLLQAISYKKFQIAEFLIKNGADVNKPDGNEITPLSAAREWGNAKLIELLIKNGADVNARDVIREAREEV